MLFTSFVFLSIFLPLVFLLHQCFASTIKAKNDVLLFASLVFILWGGLLNLLLVLYVCFVSFFGVKFILRKKNLFRLSVVIVLLLINLFYFKYALFFLENINLLKMLMGMTSWGPPKILLPIGISFFTFQAITYVVDVYRGVSAPAPNFKLLTLYIVFFPQLVAGPIVNYHDINSQLIHRTNNFEEIIQGIKRFITGLGKKVIIADTLGKLVNDLYGNGGWSIQSSWVFAFAYSFQIYFDFSGYSDMALGLGRMFGFKFMENFNYPYISSSITEFWRRWHMSLSTFFKNYVYIPLGGSKEGSVKTYRNLIIVFFLTGFFHGASWNFIIWGLWHGLFLYPSQFKFQLGPSRPV